ncbi:septation protein A [Methyloligella halotolerans]
MQKQPRRDNPQTESPAEAEGAVEQSMPTKMAIELGPLLIFFAMNAAKGIYFATAAFMIATVAALAFAFFRYRKVPIMPLVSGVIVMVFGGLTLYLQDATFIKLKPTIVYVTFAAVLLGGLLMKKPLLQFLFGPAFALTEEGWRKLTYRWVGFFIVMAVVNEFVWRNFSTDAWVSFKAFGFLPLTLIFALLQMPLLQRYSENTDEEERAG